MKHERFVNNLFPPIDIFGNLMQNTSKCIGFLKMNVVILCGRIGNDISIKYFDSGAAKVEINLAVDNYKNKEKKTLWVKAVFWGTLAETVHNYCKKGDQILINGRLEKDTWTQKDGTNASMIYVSVIALDLLSSGSERGAAKAQESSLDTTIETQLNPDAMPF